MAVDTAVGLMVAIRPFTPTRENPAVLEARTVGREHLLAQLARRLREAAQSQNFAHTLIVGPRGAGKSHVVSVALHQLASETHAEHLAVVRLPEDLVGVLSYPALLDEILTLLGGTVDGSDVGASEAAINTAIAGRTLVLVLENLDRFFGGLGKNGQHDFRGWVESARNVLVLGTAPLLFASIQDRNQPWFGSFNIEHLEDLTLSEGTTLLGHLRPDDEALREFIATASGQARLQALSDLTGGSARLWTILGDILTVDLLDELVPALEKLLEELVTYYQQRLWDLGPNEQAIVKALGTGFASQTPSELAKATRIDQRTVGATLGRLADSRWVRGRKVEGLDQRSTWYELREPMLRHHFQYRQGGTEPLALVVEVLRAWYDPEVRQQFLINAPADSLQERYPTEAMSLDGPRGFHAAYLDRNIDDLLAEARGWIVGTTPTAGSADAGAVIEAIVFAVREPNRPLPQRAVSAYAEGTIAKALSYDSSKSEEESVSHCLTAAAATATGELGIVLTWLAACWAGHTAPGFAREQLAALANQLPTDNTLLNLAVRDELAYYIGQADDHTTALELYEAVAADRTRVFGADHPDTLISRHNIAFNTGQTGDCSTALELYEAVIADQTRILGAEHPHTVITRRNLARTAVRFLKEASPDTLETVAGDGLASLLLSARAGDREALARLPSYVRNIVEPLTGFS